MSDTLAPAAPQASRQVAVTFDDLPGVVGGGIVELESVTERLVRAIQDAGVPAVGFVNEDKLAVAGEEARRTALLRVWLDAGLELGNHTYSHPSFFDTPRADFEAEVLRGEAVTRQLLAGRGMAPRYFRHPYLNTGPTLEEKAAFERFLGDHGYVVAPVTIDNDEWIYAAAYTRAVGRGDAELMARIGADYVRYMSETFEFYENLSRGLLGREPAQILLLHANALNADHLPELLAMIRARGYRFVTLDEALQDEAYDQVDTFIGRAGVSWIQRWAVSRGADPGTPPSVPAWVTEVE